MVAIHYQSGTQNYSLSPITPEEEKVLTENFQEIQQLEKKVALHEKFGSDKEIQLWHDKEGHLVGFLDGSEGYEYKSDHFEHCPQGDQKAHLDKKCGKKSDVTIKITAKEISIIPSDEKIGSLTYLFLEKILGSKEIKEYAQTLHKALHKVEDEEPTAQEFFTAYIYAKKKVSDLLQNV